jgi:SAM-dependent methyltransferase
MNKLALLQRIKHIYENNENITEYLRKVSNEESNSWEDILISYDFQAGSYVDNYYENKEIIDDYCSEIGEVVNRLELDQANNYLICEAGVGEATTLTNVSKVISDKFIKYGFDLSWSRIAVANKFVKEQGINDINLVVGDLFNAPYLDDSFDIVYTSLTIEPNGGREEEALKQLYRITRQYLILLEPSYELASEEGKNRMVKHGYIRNLYSKAQELGLEILEYRLFDVITNPLNPTALMVIKKPQSTDRIVKDPLCCPVTKSPICKKLLLAVRCFFPNGVFCPIQ